MIFSVIMFFYIIYAIISILIMELTKTKGPYDTTYYRHPYEWRDNRTRKRIIKTYINDYDGCMYKLFDDLTEEQVDLYEKMDKIHALQNDKSRKDTVMKWNEWKYHCHAGETYMDIETEIVYRVVGIKNCTYYSAIGSVIPIRRTDQDIRGYELMKKMHRIPPRGFLFYEGDEYIGKNPLTTLKYPLIEYTVEKVEELPVAPDWFEYPDINKVNDRVFSDFYERSDYQHKKFGRMYDEFQKIENKEVRIAIENLYVDYHYE